MPNRVLSVLGKIWSRVFRKYAGALFNFAICPLCRRQNALRETIDSGASRCTYVAKYVCTVEKNRKLIPKDVRMRMILYVHICQFY